MTKASFELYCYLLILPLQVEVPFEFHRFIIGRGGENVRKLMNHHDVNIKVPSSDQQSSIIVVTGPKAHVQSAETGTVKSSFFQFRTSLYIHMMIIIRLLPDGKDFVGFCRPLMYICS